MLPKMHYHTFQDGKNIFCHRLRNYSKRRRNVRGLQRTEMLLSLKLDHSTALHVNPKAVFVPISN